MTPAEDPPRLRRILGLEDPRHVSELIRRPLERFADVEIGVHVHNLPGNGAANIVAALDAGAAFVEGRICGTGGGIVTPTPLGAAGTLATGDIVHLPNEWRAGTGLATVGAVAALGIARLLDIGCRSDVTAAGPRAGISAHAAGNARAHPA